MNTRQLILTVLATLTIFGAGIGTGHRLARINLERPPMRSPQQQQGGMPLMGRLDLYARMVRDLNLDPMQRQRINRLIAERTEYLADIVRLLDPELHEMMPRLRREVEGILRPEQVQELERRFTERMKWDNSGEPRRRMPGRQNPPDGRSEGQRPMQRPGPNPNRPPSDPLQ